MGSIYFEVLDEELSKMSKITQNIYETSGPFLDTITLKSSMPNILSNHSFYSAHFTYLWQSIAKKKTPDFNRSLPFCVTDYNTSFAVRNSDWERALKKFWYAKGSVMALVPLEAFARTKMLFPLLRTLTVIVV